MSKKNYFDELSLYEESEPETAIKKPKVESYSVIYASEDFVVVNKPAGLLTVPDRFIAALPCLEHQLRKKFGEIFVVHRIDKETSGVILFARNKDAHRNFSLMFESRKVKKTYLALVEGVPNPEEGIISLAIGSDTRKPGTMKVDSKEGKESITAYRVLEKFRKASLVELLPTTGRQHQIRVHCAGIGHPLIVDSVYGTKSAFLLSSFKRGYKAKKAGERPLLARLSLHALRLEFEHPVTMEQLSFEAPIAKDMQATLKQLRLHDCIKS